MTRSTHLPRPTAAELAEFLQRCDWSAYHAARLTGVTGSTMQKCVRGELSLQGGLWRLLQVYASESVRDSLPVAVLP